MSTSSSLTKATKNHIQHLFSTVKTVSTTAVLVLVMSLGICFSKAQSSPRLVFGGGVQLLSSGNGHGAFYSPNLSMSYGANSFFIGTLTHKNSGFTRGGKLTYSRNLSGNHHEEENHDGANYDRFQLNAYGYVQYSKNIPLCQSVVKTEQCIRREINVDWSHVQLTTAEAGVGIKFEVNISRYLSISSSIGAGVYNHLNYIKGMDHEKIAPTLNLSTGINISLD